MKEKEPRFFDLRMEPYAYKMHGTINPVSYDKWFVRDYSRPHKITVDKGEWVIVVGRLCTPSWPGTPVVRYDTLFLYEGKFFVATYLDLTKFQMKILSVKFVDPFVVKPGKLFYYTFNEWMNLPGNRSYKSLREGNLEDGWVMVFGYIESVTFNRLSENTLILTNEGFYITPYVFIDRPLEK